MIGQHRSEPKNISAIWRLTPVCVVSVLYLYTAVFNNHFSCKYVRHINLFLCRFCPMHTQICRMKWMLVAKLRHWKRHYRFARVLPNPLDILSYWDGCTGLPAQAHAAPDAWLIYDLGYSDSLNISALRSALHLYRLFLQSITLIFRVCHI